MTGSLLFITEVTILTSDIKIFSPSVTDYRATGIPAKVHKEKECQMLIISYKPVLQAN
jgi:hypothetical protein